MTLNEPDKAMWPTSARSLQIGGGAPAHALDFASNRPGPIVLCLHGLGGSALNFGLVGPILAPTHRVIALDLYGHGETGASPAEQRPAAQLESQLQLIERVLAEISEQPVLLVGHSLGGILALLHTVRHPDTVERLILLDPPVPRRTRLPIDVGLGAKRAFLQVPGVRSLAARALARLTPEQIVQRQLEQATPHAVRIDRDAISASVEQTRRRTSRPDAERADRTQWAAILATMQILIHPDRWQRQLEAIRPPILWLQGADDRLVKFSDASTFTAAHPDWAFYARAGVGHLPHLEDPVWTAQTITRWLDSAPVTGSG
jgi:pimeloyl-ACP methyl ester carboxylesterase